MSSVAQYAALKGVHDATAYVAMSVAAATAAQVAAEKLISHVGIVQQRQFPFPSERGTPYSGGEEEALPSVAPRAGTSPSHSTSRPLSCVWPCTKVNFVILSANIVQKKKLNASVLLLLFPIVSSGSGIGWLSTW